MGTYGKILGILNALAIAAFLWLAGLDYGKRQSWQFAVHQQEILLRGLPVDENELDFEGRRMASTINTRMREQLFQGMGQPVKTGQQEAEKRHSELRSAIEGQNEQAKREMLASFVLPLARSLSERQQLKQKISTATLEDLLGPEGPFEEAFREALQGKKDAQGQTDYQAWRQSIARVLVNTSNPQELQRAVVVAGLESYLKELNAQATTLEKMEPELQTEMARDRTAWELERGSLLRRIIGLSERLQALDSSLKKQEELRDLQHKKQVQDRNKNVEDLKQLIVKTQDELKTELARQAELEKELEDANKGVAAALAQNDKLQNQLRERVVGR